MDEKIKELLTELLVSKIEQRLVERLSKHYDLLSFSECVAHALSDDAVVIDEQALDELGSGTLARYISKSQDQLRRQKFGSGSLKSQVRKRTNRVQGIKRANRGLEREPEPPVDETLDSDASIEDFIHDFIKSKSKKFAGDSKKQRIRRAIGAFYHRKNEGLGDVAAHVATHALAQGLGVQPSVLHALAARAAKKPKSAKAPTKVKLNKPKHVAPPTTHHEPGHDDGSVHMHQIFHGEPGEHERNHLQQALSHHNTGMAAKSAADHSKATVHFRARDKHFRNYVNNAPHEHLQKLDQELVKRHFSYENGQ
jgi:hypothetical protein